MYDTFRIYAAFIAGFLTALALSGLILVAHVDEAHDCDQDKRVHSESYLP